MAREGRLGTQRVADEKPVNGNCESTVRPRNDRRWLGHPGYFKNGCMKGKNPTLTLTVWYKEYFRPPSCCWGKDVVTEASPLIARNHEGSSSHHSPPDGIMALGDDPWGVAWSHQAT